MNLHQKQLDQITYQDIVEFCKAQPIEDARLDFKKALPKDLSKHFATFSNTLGGLIIIGVEEDSKTGLPKSWEGVEFDGKIYDQIHQMAANVSPFPRYEVLHTDEYKGKVFFIIKILPGDTPPYMTNKDTSVWIRTGNISTKLRTAESKELEFMYKKSHQAAISRDEVLKAADDIFKAYLESIEHKREQNFQQNGKTLSGSLKDQVVHLKISIMPTIPHEPIVNYKDLKTRISEYRATKPFDDFPVLNVDTVHKGIAFGEWVEWNDSYFFGLIQDNGSIVSVNDVQQFYGNDTAHPIVYLNHLMGYTARALMCAKNLYKMAGYNGALTGIVKLENTKGRPLVVHPPSNWTFFDDTSKPAIHTNLEWSLSDLDTFKLYDQAVLTEIILDTAEKIIWSFGGQVPSSDLLKDILKQQGWNVPE